MEEISHTRWAASYATDGSLTRSNGLPSPRDAIEREAGQEPGASQVAPPSPDRTNPMSLAPPLKNRPTWKVPTTVLPNAKVSGSTSVACWLDGFVNGSELTCVRGTFACAGAAQEHHRRDDDADSGTAQDRSPGSHSRNLCPHFADAQDRLRSRQRSAGGSWPRRSVAERLGRHAAPSRCLLRRPRTALGAARAYAATPAAMMVRGPRHARGASADSSPEAVAPGPKDGRGLALAPSRDRGSTRDDVELLAWVALFATTLPAANCCAELSGEQLGDATSGSGRRSGGPATGRPPGPAAHGVSRSGAKRRAQPSSGPSGRAREALRVPRMSKASEQRLGPRPIPGRSRQRGSLEHARPPRRHAWAQQPGEQRKAPTSSMALPIPIATNAR